MLNTSDIITIVYFCTNTLFLTILALHVKRTGEHSSNTSYIKDVWSQRKIYAPILVHFYDTATDIGVVYYWYTLMMDEQSDRYDYATVDMAVFFWAGITFLLFYRVSVFIVVIALNVTDNDTETSWWDLLLVLLDVYILKTVYLSAKEARDVIDKNIKARAEKNASKSSPTTTDPETGDAGQTQTKADIQIKAIEVHPLQQFMQWGESITESLPQILLQSVFIIRSRNEPKLRDTDVFLLLLSIIASVISISNKYIAIVDDESFSGTAESPNLRKSLPCVSPLYVVRVMWRFCNIVSQLCVYALIWTVMGGAWLGIWLPLYWSGYVIVVYLHDDDSSSTTDRIGGSVFLATVSLVGSDPTQTIAGQCVKYIQSIIGLAVVAVFACTSFECAICADSDYRRFDNDNDNNRMAVYFVMGGASLLSEVVCFAILRACDVVDE